MVNVCEPDSYGRMRSYIGGMICKYALYPDEWMFDLTAWKQNKRSRHKSFFFCRDTQMDIQEHDPYPQGGKP